MVVDAVGVVVVVSTKVVVTELVGSIRVSVLVLIGLFFSVEGLTQKQRHAVAYCSIFLQAVA